MSTEQTQSQLPAGSAVDELFGERIVDRYRWLEDESSPLVQQWMREQDADTRQYLDSVPGRNRIARRLAELYYLDDRTAPIKRGQRLFFARRSSTQEKQAYLWQHGEAGQPQVLLDPNPMSADGSLSIGGIAPSKDGQYLAYLETPNNADESTLRVLEVATGQPHPQDTIAGLRYTLPSWTQDSRGFFYTWLPTDPGIPEHERLGYAEVRFHALGTDPKTDPVVKERTGDASRSQNGYVSEDGAFLFLAVRRGWSQNDLYVKRLAGTSLDGPWGVLAEGVHARFEGFAYREQLYVLTNREAPNYRLCRVHPDRLGYEHWDEVLPEPSDAVIRSAAVIGGKLAVRRLRNGHTELVLYHLDGRELRPIPLPGLGTASDWVGNQDDETAYWRFSSYDCPPEIHRTSVASAQTQLFFRANAPVDRKAVAVSQVWYDSLDGTRVSMFLIHRPDMVQDGKNPTLLYGYGGFNLALTPSFLPILWPWLEAGGIYAVPHLRGGGEYGEAWHRAGMLGNKQNVFDDFVSAARWLIDRNYTQPAKLAIMGQSNGGLLVGAAMTQYPELFGAVVCGVPLLDMLRYHKSGMGMAWVPEYGNPDEAEHFKWLRAYSPYHRLEPGRRYPALLMLTADSDDRVDPMHARKFVAQLQAYRRPGDPPALVRIETNAGHSGGDLRRKDIARDVDELAFLFSALGVSSQPTAQSR
ncbi:prolyl oligopeptidase family protein [Myxococcota bacterium]